MSIRTLSAAYATALTVFLVVDGAWLMLVAIDMFQREIGGILRPMPYFGAVAALYLIYAVAMTYLAVLPAVDAKSLSGAAWRGAVLGFGAYGLYDLTNHATINGYPLWLALSDMAWGTFATTLACFAGCAVAMRVR